MTTADTIPASWRPRCARSLASGRPSEVIVPGLLEGLDNVNRLAAPWLGRAGASPERMRRPA